MPSPLRPLPKHHLLSSPLHPTSRQRPSFRSSFESASLPILLYLSCLPVIPRISRSNRILPSRHRQTDTSCPTTAVIVVVAPAATVVAVEAMAVTVTTVVVTATAAATVVVMAEGKSCSSSPAGPLLGADEAVMMVPVLPWQAPRTATLRNGGHRRCNAGISKSQIANHYSQSQQRLLQRRLWRLRRRCWRIRRRWLRRRRWWLRWWLRRRRRR